MFSMTTLEKLYWAGAEAYSDFGVLKKSYYKNQAVYAKVVHTKAYIIDSVEKHKRQGGRLDNLYRGSPDNTVSISMHGPQFIMVFS